MRSPDPGRRGPVAWPVFETGARHEDEVAKLAEEFGADPALQDRHMDRFYMPLGVG